MTENKNNLQENKTPPDQQQNQGSDQIQRNHKEEGNPSERDITSEDKEELPAAYHEKNALKYFSNSNHRQHNKDTNQKQNQS